MVTKNPQGKKPEIVAGELAAAALVGNLNPIDMDMTGIDPDPTSLGMDNAEEFEMCSTHHCSHDVVETCESCGSPLCDDCA